MLTQLDRLYIEKENNLQVIRWNGYGTIVHGLFEGSIPEFAKKQ